VPAFERLTAAGAGFRAPLPLVFGNHDAFCRIFHQTSLQMRNHSLRKIIQAYQDARKEPDKQEPGQIILRKEGMPLAEALPKAP
jgi:hypothetical protein